MPKIRTHKGSAKRVKTTKNGKLLRKRAFGNHFLTKKSSARKRKYSRIYKIKGAQKKNLKRMLGAN